MIALLALVVGFQTADAQDDGGGEGLVADRLRGVEERLESINQSNAQVLWVSTVIAAIAAIAAVYYGKQLRGQLAVTKADAKHRLRPVLAWGALGDDMPIGVYGESGRQGGLRIRLVNAGQVSAEEIVAHLDVRLVGDGEPPCFRMRRLGALGPGESVVVRFPMPATELGRALGGGMAYVEARLEYGGGGSKGLTYRVAGYMSGTLFTLFGVADTAMSAGGAVTGDRARVPAKATDIGVKGEADAKRALEKSDTTIAADPHDATAHRNRATALRLLGRTAEALEAAREARERDPTDVEALRETARILDALGRYDEAIGALRRIEERGESGTDVKRELVRLHALLGQHEEAHSALSRIAAQEPGYAAYMDLAERSMTLRQYDSAIMEFRAAIEAKPSGLDAHLGRGMAQMNAGRRMEAAATFRMAISLDPGSADAHAGLAQALYALGENQEALEEFRLAAEADPGNQRVHVTRGAIMLEMGLRGEAQGPFAEARRLDPSMQVPSTLPAADGQADSDEK